MKLDKEKIKKSVGSYLQLDDEIVINTNTNEKSILLYRAGKKYNIFNALTKDSIWLTLIQGPNEIRYNTDTTNVNLRLYLNYKPLYEGI